MQKDFEALAAKDVVQLKKLALEKLALKRDREIDLSEDIWEGVLGMGKASHEPIHTGLYLTSRRRRSYED